MWLPLFGLLWSNPCWIIQNPIEGFMVGGCSLTVKVGMWRDNLRYYEVAQKKRGSSGMLNKHSGDWQRWINLDPH